jgi:hypothetical protein
LEGKDKDKYTIFYRALLSDVYWYQMTSPVTPFGLPEFAQRLIIQHPPASPPELTAFARDGEPIGKMDMQAEPSGTPSGAITVVKGPWIVGLEIHLAPRG